MKGSSHVLLVDEVLADNNLIRIGSQSFEESLDRHQVELAPKRLLLQHPGEDFG